MKKTVYSLLAIFLLTSCSESLNDSSELNSKDNLKLNENEASFNREEGFSFDGFLTKNLDVVSLENSTLQDFKTLNPQFDFSLFKNQIESHELNNEIDIIFNLEFIDKSDFTNSYIKYDKNLNSFEVYYVIVSLDSYVEVYNSEKEFMYKFYNQNGFAKFSKTPSDASKKTCFQYCMDYVEEQMTDDFIGWTAWNYSPGVQLAAGYGCHRVCNGTPYNQVF